MAAPRFFTARTHYRCPGCGEDIDAGDDVAYVDEQLLCEACAVDEIEGVN